MCGGGGGRRVEGDKNKKKGEIIKETSWSQHSLSQNKSNGLGASPACPPAGRTGCRPHSAAGAGVTVPCFYTAPGSQSASQPDPKHGLYAPAARGGNEAVLWQGPAIADKGSKSNCRAPTGDGKLPEVAFEQATRTSDLTPREASQGLLRELPRGQTLSFASLRSRLANLLDKSQQ